MATIVIYFSIIVEKAREKNKIQFEFEFNRYRYHCIQSKSILLILLTVAICSWLPSTGSHILRVQMLFLSNSVRHRCHILVIVLHQNRCLTDIDHSRVLHQLLPGGAERRT